MYDRDGKLIQYEGPWARVKCHYHGFKYLTHTQYIEQMERPGDQWRCPICGAISEFDDRWFEMTHFPSEDSGDSDL